MPYRSSLCLMATMVRERRISPVELVEAHFRQIARHNPKINAFVVLLEEEAREAAKQAEAAVMRGETPGLLHGVPVTVKDSFDMAGLPPLCRSKVLLGDPPSQEQTSAARLPAPAAPLLRKTTSPALFSHYHTPNNHN